jgi:DNA-binding transcriptional LysR family regulator
MSRSLRGRIQLRHLTCFVVVAQERTLARAAGRLSLSQPAVSKTLSELEAMAGERLVERRRTGAKLTAAGERFLRYALDVTHAVDSATQALARADAPSAPSLRVGALPTVAGGLLARALLRLSTQRSNSAVLVHTASNPELLASLRAGEIDLAVGRMAEPDAMQGIAFELLYSESLAVVTRADHPLQHARAEDVSARTLLDYPLVVPGQGTAPRHHTEVFFQEHGVAMPDNCVETQSISAARALTVLGDAVWITSQRAVQLDVDMGWLRQVELAAPGSIEPIGVLHRSRESPGEFAADLMENLRALA